MNYTSAGDLDGMAQSKVLKRLETLRNAVAEAECDLEDFLVELHASGHWEQVTYAQLAGPMGCSRQAVQQRVLRLLERGADRQSYDRAALVHPGQQKLL